MMRNDTQRHATDAQRTRQGSAVTRNMIGSSRQRRAARRGTAYTAVIAQWPVATLFTSAVSSYDLFLVLIESSLHPSFLNHNLLLDLLVLGVYQMFPPWIY